MMKAAVCTAYGEVELKEIPIPIPKDNEIQIKVFFSSVNSADWRILKGEPKIMRLGLGGLFRPRQNLVLGMDVAGIVQSVGKNVKKFEIGDKVFGELSNGFHLGAYAEYCCFPETATIVKMSPTMTFEVAASLPVACTTAWQSMKIAKIEPDMKVLINGAAGGVGTFAVQLAKLMGAEVTGVCSTLKVDTVKSLGADHVIDYKTDDYTTRTESFDVILDIAAYRPLTERLKALKPHGRYILVGGDTSEIFKIFFQKIWTKKSVGNLISTTTCEDLEKIAELYENGKVKPLMMASKTINLEQVLEGLQFVEQGNAIGKVLVQINV